MGAAAKADPVERIMTAIIEPMYEHLALKRGQHFSRRTGVPGIMQVSEIGLDDLGGMSMSQLGSLHDNLEHPAARMIEAECSRKCGTRFQCISFFSEVTVCDVCRKKYEKEERLRQAKTYWEEICPESLRDTDRGHAGFPRAQYATTKDWIGGNSLLLYGDTRTGKTRLGMWLLKRCLVKANLHVGVLWPETLKSMKKTFAPTEELNRWARYDVLLMDDALLAGAMDSRITDWLKDLIDLRMRHKRHCIITSQIGSADYKEQSNKFAEATGADKKLIEALCARVSEICTVIPFTSAKAAIGEDPF